MSAPVAKPSDAQVTFNVTTRSPAHKALFSYEKLVNDLAVDKIKPAPTPPSTRSHKSAFYVVKKPYAKK